MLLRIAGRPKSWGWFLVMVIVPYIGSLAFLVVYIIVANDISKSFGHGTGFTVGLVLLNVIFWWILLAGLQRVPGASGSGGRRRRGVRGRVGRPSTRCGLCGSSRRLRARWRLSAAPSGRVRTAPPPPPAGQMPPPPPPTDTPPAPPPPP